MYNGVGLRTPRGSGTSGHIQGNLSYVKQKRSTDYVRRQNELKEKKQKLKQANLDILLHEKKRKVESDLLKWKMKLQVNKNLTKEDIEERIKSERKRRFQEVENQIEKMKEENLEKEKRDDILRKRGATLYEDEKERRLAKKDRKKFGGDSKSLNSHQLKEAQSRKNEVLRKAFNISKDEYVEGASFDRELQEKKKEERKKRREEKIRSLKKMKKKHDSSDSEYSSDSDDSSLSDSDSISDSSDYSSSDESDVSTSKRSKKDKSKKSHTIKEEDIITKSIKPTIEKERQDRHSPEKEHKHHNVNITIKKEVPDTSNYKTVTEEIAEKGDGLYNRASEKERDERRGHSRNRYNRDKYDQRDTRRQYDDKYNSRRYDDRYGRNRKEDYIKEIQKKTDYEVPTIKQEKTEIKERIDSEKYEKELKGLSTSLSDHKDEMKIKTEEDNDKTRDKYRKESDVGYRRRDDYDRKRRRYYSSDEDDRDYRRKDRYYGKRNDQYNGSRSRGSYRSRYRERSYDDYERSRKRYSTSPSLSPEPPRKRTK